jgi:hypothetical protein
MSGTPLSQFSMFAHSQGAAWVDSAEHVLQDISRQTYTWPRLINGKNMQSMIQGGESIKDRVLFSGQSTFTRYDPNPTVTFNIGDPGTDVNVPWAFAHFHFAWTKQHIGLNINSFTAAARAQKFKDVWTQLSTEAWVDACESMDDELWAQPDAANMESTSPTAPRKPMSIPAYINESTNGLTVAAVDAGATLWTTVATVAVASNTQYVPYHGTYTFSDGSGGLPTTAAQCSPLIRGLSTAFRKTTFDRLPKNEQYSDPKTSPNFIACSNLGIATIEHALVVSQNRWNGLSAGGSSDLAYPFPMFKGVPFDYISALDTATLFDDGSSGAAVEASADLAGPRFYGINGRYMKMYVHRDNFCAPEDVNPSAQPFTHAMIFDVWNNLFCPSRRHHFIMSPSADVPSAV